MIRLIPALVLVASLAAMGRPPRFLGPPEKKPADAGVPDAGAAHGEADAPVLKIDDDAPLFSGVLHNPDMAGVQRIDLSNLVGSEADADQAAKAVLISFFATWCKPCKKELPLLQQLSTEYKEKGLRVISVSIDKEEALWPQITELAKENHVTYPIVKDRYNLIARQYLGDKTALPSVFIVNRDGKVAMVKQGYPNDAADFLRAEVEKALK
jgi:thiol-disulfide isomerase/thioredoxin